MPGYVEKNLHPGETIEYRGRVSLVAALHRGVIILTVGLLVLVLAEANTSTDPAGETTPNAWLTLLSLVILLWGIARIIGGLLFRRSAEYVVTDRRVIGKYGVVRQESVDVLMTAISGISVANTALGRIFGYGNVLVNGAGASRRLVDLANPKTFQSAVHARLGESRLLKGTAGYTLDVRVAPEPRSEAAAPGQNGSAPAATGARFCGQCGQQSAPGVKFCESCGGAVGQPA